MTDPFALLFLRRLEHLVYLRRAVRAIWHEDNWRKRLLDRGICSTIDDLALLGYEQQAREIMADAREKLTPTAMHDGCNSDPDKYIGAMCATCAKRKACFDE